MTTTDELTAQLEEKQDELAELEAQLSEARDRVADLRREASISLAGADLPDIEEVARQTAKARVDLDAGESVVAELTRRMGVTSERVKSIERQLRVEEARVYQEQLDDMAAAAADKLRVLDADLDAIFKLKHQVRASHDVGLKSWFSHSFSVDCKHQLRVFDRDFLARDPH